MIRAKKDERDFKLSQKTSKAGVRGPRVRGRTWPDPPAARAQPTLSRTVRADKHFKHQDGSRTGAV